MPVSAGMRSTRLYDDYAQVVPKRALGYVPGEGGGYATELYLFDLVGDGGVLTCLEDLARWDENLYDNRRGDGEALIARMLTPGVLNSGKVLDFDPDRRALAIADLLLADKFAPTARAGQAAEAPRAETANATVQPTAAALAAFAATYRSPTGRVFEVHLAEDALRLALAPEQSFDLVATAEASFTAKDAPFQLRVDFLDGGKTMEVQVADQAPRRFARIEPWVPSSTELAEIAGDYHSTELQATYAVTVAAGTLRIAIGYRDDIMRLTPTVRDEFALGGGVARIERTDGRVTGIRVNVGRVRGIVFARC